MQNLIRYVLPSSVKILFSTMDLKGSDAFRFYAHELFNIYFPSFDVTNAEDCQSPKESYELLSSD